MRHNICSDFIHFLDEDGSLQAENAPKEVQQWLEGLGLPIGLLRFMQWEWPQSDCQIAHISIHSSASLFADAATPCLIKHKFINAGSAPNGDWFVVDFSTEACVPGFITHEEWSPWSDEPEDPRMFFQPIARSFESLLYRAVEKKYLPTDYYSAKAFNSFIAEEQKS